MTELERECQRLTKLLDQENVVQLIHRMAMAKDTGKVFAHIFTEATMLMQAAVNGAGLQTIWEAVEKEAA